MTLPALDSTAFSAALAAQLRLDLEAYWNENKSLPLAYSYCWGVLRAVSQTSDSGIAEAFAMCDAFLREANAQLTREQYERAIR